MFSKVTKWSIAGVVLSVLFACGVPLSTSPALYNFGVVEPGRLYRTARPTTTELALMISDYPIQSVLYLDSDPMPGQTALLESENITLHQVSIRADSCLDKGTDAIIDVLINENNYPLLIFCEWGADRTGRVVALYRYLMHDWTVDRALEELRSFQGLRAGEPECLGSLFSYSATYIENKSD